MKPLRNLGRSASVGNLYALVKVFPVAKVEICLGLAPDLALCKRRRMHDVADGPFERG